LLLLLFQAYQFILERGAVRAISSRSTVSTSRTGVNGFHRQKEYCRLQTAHDVQQGFDVFDMAQQLGTTALRLRMKSVNPGISTISNVDQTVLRDDTFRQICNAPVRHVDDCLVHFGAVPGCAGGSKALKIVVFAA